MMTRLVGDRAVFALEIGDRVSAGLQVVDVWASGVRLTAVDNLAYVPSFCHYLRRAAEQVARRQQQLAAFLQCQEAMRGSDVQHGRRLIYRVGRGAELPNVDTADHYSITAAMSVLDLIGGHVRRGVVPRKWAVECWHATLRDLRIGYRKFVARRIERTGETAPWPDLDDLFDLAARHRCWRPCCPPSTNGHDPTTVVAAVSPIGSVPEQLSPTDSPIPTAYES